MHVSRIGIAAFVYSYTNSIVFAAVNLPWESFGIPGQNATFDYIVVGGGTAGNTVAARLAENSANRVAIVEAGGFYQIESGNRSVVPGYSFANQAAGQLPSPLTDWGFVTVPQKGCHSRKVNYARGRTLGGSSALNYLGYHRSTIGSYQAWATAVDDDSYTWDNLLPFFRKSVTFTPTLSEFYQNSSLNYDTAEYTGSGPLHVSYPEWAPAFGSWIQLGLRAIGIYPNNGLDSGSLFGSNWVAQTLNPHDKQRSSSASSFLELAFKETTLQVYSHTLAQKILFDKNKVATGIQVLTGNQTYTLTASREIVISAGAFQSPQLLMVSGIGPSLTLERYNIPVIANLSGVGQNMWDHVQIESASRVNIATTTKLQTDPEYARDAVELYKSNGSGILTAAGGLLAWEKIPPSFRTNLSASTIQALRAFPDDWPELEHGGLNGYAGTMDITDKHNYASIASILLTPLSRGNVTIKSDSTSDLPIINPNWLSDPADIEQLIIGFKRQRIIWSSISNVTIGEEFAPGIDVTTDAEIESYIREALSLAYHASCTCKMGVQNDTMAVIDSRARVFGVKRLRVVDASAFPLLPPGHPQATIYMLAEKIADDILKCS